MSTVLESILAATADARVRAAMALGALLEGGSLGAGPFPTGDNGTSPGPFQIHLPAHPGVTTAQAQNPQSAVAFMLGEYTGAVNRVPASLWTSNPQQAAEQAAYMAERPAQDYYTSRPGAVQSAWATVTGALATGNLAAPSGADAGPGATAQNAGLSDVVPWLFGVPAPTATLAAVPKLLTIGAAITAGAALVVVGLNKAAGNPAGRATKAAATVAPLAAL